MLLLHNGHQQNIYSMSHLLFSPDIITTIKGVTNKHNFGEDGAINTGVCYRSYVLCPQQEFFV
jgi:hypothetical protein